MTQPTFHNSFADNDLRRIKGLLIGKQYPCKVGEDGNYYYNATVESLKGSEEYNGQDLAFINYVKSMTEDEENSGARSIKYEIQPGATDDMSNDWVMFRHSEAIYNEVEALMRKNGDKVTQGVVGMINSIRQRFFKAGGWGETKYTTATLAMDEFSVEKDREFVFEGIRRTDSVRFNKSVTTSW